MLYIYRRSNLRGTVYRSLRRKKDAICGDHVLSRVCDLVTATELVVGFL
jgi:hypothetical protein